MSGQTSLDNIAAWVSGGSSTVSMGIKMPHSSHFSLKKAIREAKKINAKITYFTHMYHMLDHDIHGQNLPKSMHFSYDGLEIEI